jgi:hypothetical protein
MQRSASRPDWVTAESLRVAFMRRCEVYCERTGTPMTILSWVLSNSASWLKHRAKAGADMKFTSYDRAMRKLDEFEAMKPWPRLRIATAENSAIIVQPGARRSSHLSAKRAYFLALCAESGLDRATLSKLLVGKADADLDLAIRRLDDLIHNPKSEESHGEKTASKHRGVGRGGRGRKSDRGKGRSIHKADRKPDSRPRQRARGVDGAVSANS